MTLRLGPIRLPLKDPGYTHRFNQETMSITNILPMEYDVDSVTGRDRVRFYDKRRTTVSFSRALVTTYTDKRSIMGSKQPITASRISKLGPVNKADSLSQSQTFANLMAAKKFIVRS